MNHSTSWRPAGQVIVSLALLAMAIALTPTIHAQSSSNGASRLITIDAPCNQPPAVPSGGAGSGTVTRLRDNQCRFQVRVPSTDETFSSNANKPRAPAVDRPLQGEATVNVPGQRGQPAPKPVPQPVLRPGVPQMDQPAPPTNEPFRLSTATPVLQFTNGDFTVKLPLVRRFLPGETQWLRNDNFMRGSPVGAQNAPWLKFRIDQVVSDPGTHQIKQIHATMLEYNTSNNTGYEMTPNPQAWRPFTQRLKFTLR